MAEQQNTAHLHPSTGGHRVLVVNDYPDIVASLALCLRLYGHQVETALGGEEGLEKAKVQKPEVAILDLTMSKMDGFELARQLRQSFAGSIRLIAVTARDAPEDLRRCQEAGFDQHLRKPADPAQLEHMLRQLARTI